MKVYVLIVSVLITLAITLFFIIRDKKPKEESNDFTKYYWIAIISFLGLNLIIRSGFTEDNYTESYIIELIPFSSNEESPVYVIKSNENEYEYKFEYDCEIDSKYETTNKIFDDIRNDVCVIECSDLTEPHLTIYMYCTNYDFCGYTYKTEVNYHQYDFYVPEGTAIEK